jgi:hypothetical protein
MRAILFVAIGGPALSYLHITLSLFCENGKEFVAWLFDVRWQR